jgi:hypothetical protein
LVQLFCSEFKPQLEDCQSNDDIDRLLGTIARLSLVSRGRFLLASKPLSFGIFALDRNAFQAARLVYYSLKQASYSFGVERPCVDLHDVLHYLSFAFG